MSPATIAEPVHDGLLALWEDVGASDISTPGSGGRPAGTSPAGRHSGAAVEDIAATLEQVVTARWAALEAGFLAECLLCGGDVHPRWSAGAGVVGGRCDECGTELE